MKGSKKKKKELERLQFAVIGHGTCSCLFADTKEQGGEWVETG